MSKLIDYTLEGKVDKVAQAIQRIKTFDPIATGMMDEPYYVAYSGGKDSDVIRILCQLAGVSHELVHNHTCLDAPETVQHVRSIPGIVITYPEITPWRLFEHRGIPTRKSRFCCKDLKERGGKGRFVMTGVRWSESRQRTLNRGGVEVGGSMKAKLILSADNDESRRVLENCQLKGRYILNPIIDWHDNDVWEFLHHYSVTTNPIYDEGFPRVGCIGCPLPNRREREREFRRWPTYKESYIRAFDRNVRRRKAAGKTCPWNSGEEAFLWWMEEMTLYRPMEGQLLWEAV